MAKIYVSSTMSDLKEYRKAVYDVLRKLRHDVISMEDYTSADRRPLDKCLADVAACDVYVGIFAWRYGYIPDVKNPKRRSITELEYRMAVRTGKPVLIFLLDQTQAWPREWMDEVTGEGDRGQKMLTLREELGRERLCSFFKTPDQLASLVSASVQQVANVSSPETEVTVTHFKKPLVPTKVQKIPELMKKGKAIEVRFILSQPHTVRFQADHGFVSTLVHLFVDDVEIVRQQLSMFEVWGINHHFEIEGVNCRFRYQTALPIIGEMIGLWIGGHKLLGKMDLPP